MTKRKNQIESFHKWYHTEYLLSRDNYSPILFSCSKISQAKFYRICEVAKLLLSNQDIHEIRKIICKRYPPLSMRAALDDINLAKIVIDEYNERQCLNN